jgi:hypothetical protein
MQVDSDNQPHICYLHGPGGDLRYAYPDGSTWHVETMDSGLSCSLALNATDRPYISYFGDDTLDTLKYVYHDGTGWRTCMCQPKTGPSRPQPTSRDRHPEPLVACAELPVPALQAQYPLRVQVPPPLAYDHHNPDLQGQEQTVRVTVEEGGDGG